VWIRQEPSVVNVIGNADWEAVGELALAAVGGKE
jgi:hypothetical protein